MLISKGVLSKDRPFWPRTFLQCWVEKLIGSSQKRLESKADSFRWQLVANGSNFSLCDQYDVIPIWGDNPMVTRNYPHKENKIDVRQQKQLENQPDRVSPSRARPSVPHAQIAFSSYWALNSQTAVKCNVTQTKQLSYFRWIKVNLHLDSMSIVMKNRLHFEWHTRFAILNNMKENATLC